MAKRSPILGYNHNVLYRGLVFHVQTEDSGLLSPHLFTHLFYGGTIISTRKLVYDAGSAEDAIKGLMQSQHKIVLKELKKGTFDDKIDVYLKDVEGLLPRSTPGTAATPAATAAPAAVVPAETPVPQVEDRVVSGRPPRSQTEELESLDAIEPPEMIVANRPSEPVITIEHEPSPKIAIARTATPPPIPARAATPAPLPGRRVTAERTSMSRAHVAPPPAPAAEEIDPPTDPDVDSGAIQMALSNATVRTPMPQLDSAPEISIKLDLEDDDDQPIALTRTRSKHDTDIEMPQEHGDSRAATQSDGVPVRGGESIPPQPAPPERPKTGERSPSLGAAALPPVRPVTRPPSRGAIAPPTVMSRPIADQDRSDSVEVYAPAPASVEPPPGERSERPGQYAQHKRPSGGKVDVIKDPRSGGVPIPAGLSRPNRQSSSMPALQQPRAQTPSSQMPPLQPRSQTPSSQPPIQARPPSQQSSVPRAHTPSSAPPFDGIVKGRTPTPSRVSPPGSGPAARGSSSGGVVMTRPAVIVGAPAKPASPPRARKAREEEGRGFGQGLISEKSLDEVILAYLSEDADDK